MEVKTESPEIIARNIKAWNIPIPEQEYMVVIHCSTYNHGIFIEDALKGFVMQKTNFPFCAIIIDDCSTDNNAEIIQQYAMKYPEIIKPICLGENHMQNGKSRNPYFELWHHKAKYIAQCEGDDYWIDPEKLQKQVDFMETHPGYSMCFHNAFVYYVQNPKAALFNNELYEGDLTAYNAIHYWKVPTASTLIRSNIVLKKPVWFIPIYSGDYTLILKCLEEGKIFQMKDIMSVYRINTTGTSATALYKGRNVFMLKQKYILLESFKKYTGNKFEVELESKLKEINDEIKFQEIKEQKCYVKIFFNSLFYKKLCFYLGRVLRKDVTTQIRTKD